MRLTSRFSTLPIARSSLLTSNTGILLSSNLGNCAPFLLKHLILHHTSKSSFLSRLNNDYELSAKDSFSMEPVQDASDVPVVVSLFFDMLTFPLVKIIRRCKSIELSIVD